MQDASDGSVQLVPFGNYHLVSKISSGGMADVFRAKVVGIRGFSKTVAIKRIHPHLLERKRFLRMFTDEAKIAARLVHPNIAQIYELGEEDGVAFIAMEYVPGRDLYLVLQRLAELGERCPGALASRVAVELCRALQYAHEFRHFDGLPQEIVHRDVSPRNILIGFNGEVKLTDFGVARARDREEETEHGLIKGKIRYISPEAALGAVVDSRSDLFSLGVVLTEMLTMRPFRDGPNEYAILLAIRDGSADKGSLAGAPVQFEGVLEKALAHKHEERYPSARELRLDLLAQATGELQPMSSDEASELMHRLFAEEVVREQEEERKAEFALASMVRQQEAKRDAYASAARESTSDSTGVAAERLDGHVLRLHPVPDPDAGGEGTPEIAPELGGELSEISFTRVINQLASDLQTGRLDMRREPVQKLVFLDEGDPVFVSSNVEREFFGEHLVARGLLSRDDHAKCLEMSATGGVRFLDSLLALNAFPPHQLYQHLAEQVRERILELFTWPDGRFAFYAQVRPPESCMPLALGSMAIIHEGVRDRVPLVLIKRSLEGLHTRRIVRIGGAIPSGLPLSGREQRVLRTIVEKGVSINDLVRWEKGEERILRLVYLLRELELLSFA